MENGISKIKGEWTVKTISVNVTITTRGRGPVRHMDMDIEEYISFIREQAELLNVGNQPKPLTPNLKRSQPGLKDPGPYPVGGVDLGKPNGDTSNTYTVQMPALSPSSNKEILDNLAKDLNKEIRKNRRNR